MEDVDRIMSVLAQAFDPHWGEAWTRRQIEDALTLPTTGYNLAGSQGDWPGDGQDAAAFALTRQSLDEAELLLIAVVPQAQGRGIGRTVLGQVISHARARGAAKMFLEMRHNNPAQHLYRAMGFEPVGRRPNYYRLADGTRLDAVTLALTL